ncbi:hypothetical protein AB0F91_02695 [Amycolatopsis sp. NPDC023774]|uniref:hypothetical protein n=1 Tax=Amycolatopsis sp. NPDC023774 TaxID=3155015 RepID=UPI0033CAE7C7
MNWYDRVFVDTGRAAAMWAVVGFLVTFGLVRGITRRIRAKHRKASAKRGLLGDIHIGGVHVHHQVWGILLVLVVGALEFRFSPDAPWGEILAALFGVGAALVLDEFALWFYLDDVYWAENGRKSIDAVLIGGSLGVLLLLEASPIGEMRGESAMWSYLLGIAVHLVTALVCLLKGKLATGVLGVVVPLIALVGALRLAKPDSAWARRRYAGRKLDRSRRRFGARYTARHNRLRDLFGGTPNPDLKEKPVSGNAGSGRPH